MKKFGLKMVVVSSVFVFSYGCAHPPPTIVVKPAPVKTTTVIVPVQERPYYDGPSEPYYGGPGPNNNLGGSEPYYDGRPAPNNELGGQEPYYDGGSGPNNQPDGSGSPNNEEEYEEGPGGTSGGANTD